MLTDTRIKTLKPKDKLYRIADGNGLTLEVKTNGNKLWRYRYRFNNKASMVSIGKYPITTLAQARTKRDYYRGLIEDDINPATHKAEQQSQHKAEQVKSINTFSTMFNQWFVHNQENWQPAYCKDMKLRTKTHLLPYIGDTSINDLTPQIMLKTLKIVEQQGKLDTLRKVKSIASRVLRYGVGLGLIDHDPTRDLPSDVFKKKTVKHYATITDPKEIGGLLRLLENYHGSYQVATALKLAPYLFLRPSELSGLLWDEIDFSDNLIRISANRMKMNRPHLVPMAKQVLAIIQSLKNIKTDSPYLFPSNHSKTRPMVAESLRGGLRRLGLSNDEMTTHGFRHMASTRLYELGYKGDVIEIQLAHQESNKVKAAYNHAEYLAERRVMMGEWADYLDGLRG